MLILLANMHISEESSSRNELNFQMKKLGKREQIIIKIRTEVSAIKKRKTIEKINKTELDSLIKSRKLINIYPD